MPHHSIPLRRCTRCRGEFDAIAFFRIKREPGGVRVHLRRCIASGFFDRGGYPAGFLGELREGVKSTQTLKGVEPMGETATERKPNPKPEPTTVTTTTTSTPNPKPPEPPPDDNDNDNT